MRPAGLRAFEARTRRRRRRLLLRTGRGRSSRTSELARFRAVPAAWADWERRPPSYRKAVTFWVTSAKGADTRARRLEALIADSAAGVDGAPDALEPGEGVTEQRRRAAVEAGGQGAYFARVRIP